MSTHTCTAECWARIIRYGAPYECDPFTARDAADREALAVGAIAFPHEY